MEKRGARRRGREESFEATADAPGITTSRITTRRSSVNSESANSGRTSRGSVTTEKTATRVSARNRSKLVANAAPAVPPTVPESPAREAEDNVQPKRNLAPKPAKVAVVRIIPLVIERDDDGVRNSSSRQSTASGGTVDLTPAVRNETNARLANYIRRSVSSAAEVVRRSMSRQRTNSPAVTNTGSHDSNEENSDNSANVTNNSEQYLSSISTVQEGYLCREQKTLKEFGGPLGIAMLLLSLPLLVTYIVGSTFTTDGNLMESEELMLKGKNISLVFPNDVVAAFLGFQMATFLLSGILFGLEVRLPRMNNALAITFNGLPMAICMNLAWLVASHYTKFNVVDYVLENQWRFFIYGIIHAFITAMWAHLLAITFPGEKTQINLYGKTGNLLVDFAQGRQLNPKFLNFIDLKQYCYRTQLMVTLLIAECYLLKCLPALTWDNWRDILTVTFWQNIDWNSGNLLAASMLLYYVADAIIFEHHLASSFELQCEGFGALLLLRYAVTPYLLSGILRNCHLTNVNMDWFNRMYVSIAVLTFIGGIVWKRLSSATKYKYRLSPNHYYFNNVYSINTYQGRRLLVDKFWGTMRQPNYAGDIVALLSLCLPFTFSIMWQAHLAIVLLVILLFHRATRVNERNRDRYNSCWARYSSLVPYYIVPKIF